MWQLVFFRMLYKLSTHHFLSSVIARSLLAGLISCILPTLSSVNINVFAVPFVSTEKNCCTVATIFLCLLIHEYFHNSIWAPPNISFTFYTENKYRAPFLWADENTCFFHVQIQIKDGTIWNSTDELSSSTDFFWKLFAGQKLCK